VARADEAVSQMQTEALEQERQVSSELKENLDRIRTEYSLFEDRTKSEISDLSGQLEREQLSARTMKAELTAEINVLSWIAGNVRLWNQSWKYYGHGLRSLRRRRIQTHRLSC
jgi:uncharacterized protein YigA (DUF484 family)